MGDWAAGQTLPDIPRFYTAFAEWLSCIICMRMVVRRYLGWKFWGIAVAAFLVQSAFLVLTGGLDGSLWMLCMASAVLLMFCFMWICCDAGSLDVGYACVQAFVLAEFMASLECMDVMDICSIFGNALDNAIECEKKITEKEKRMIHVSVFVQQSFLIIRFENYYEEELTFEQNLPITTKKEAEFHGYGLKSLRHTVHKYGGELDINAEDNWFNLKILIPI